jgi:N6-L-threonylcarbamoyladenine synthase
MPFDSAGNHQHDNLILGIESSCDETAAAVVSAGRETLSSVVASQIATHAEYGGVVPELASREHLRNIVPVVRAAMANAGVQLQDLSAIAVTEGPGLAGALLVGVTYAKTLAWALGKPLIAVNHLEGHIHAVLLEHAAEPDAAMPALALVVSGGHTHLYLATEGGTTAFAAANQHAHATGPTHKPGWHYRLVGRTVDDAAGEAFDKVAKLLGLGYPGGPWIDALATHGDPHAVPFRFADVRPRTGHQRPATAAIEAPELLFSFSGIKTGVLRYVETHGLATSAAQRAAALKALSSTSTRPSTAEVAALCDQQTLDLIASFQRAVVDNLVERTLLAAARYQAKTILVSGGVAANRELRQKFQSRAEGYRVLFPSLALATDNAAMIAAAAWPRLQAGLLATQTLSAQPRLQLGGQPNSPSELTAP